MAKLYRKSLLEKLSSPDQLDKMVVITPPSFWIAVVGGIAIVTVALIWAFNGTIPEKVDTQGIYISDQNTYTIASEVSGIVKEVKVAVGDEVEAGDVLYTLDSDSLEEELQSLKERLEVVNSITLTSKNDTANQDTQNLLSYKAQYIAASGNSASAAYDLMLEKYEGYSADVSEAEKQAEKAYEKYAAAAALVNETSDASYSQKLSVQETLISCLDAEILYYEEAYNYYNGLESYAGSYINAIGNYQNAADEEEKNSAYQTIQTIEQGLNVKAADIRIAYASASQACLTSGRTLVDYVPSDINYNPASGKVNIKGKTVAVTELSNEITVSSAEVKTKLNEVQTMRDNAQNEYLTIQNAMANDPAYSGNSNLAYLKNAYDAAANDYQNKVQLQASAEQSLISYEASKASGESSAKSQSEGYRTQFMAIKGSLVDQLEQEIEKYEKQIELNTVTSTMDGIITNLAVNKGTAISQGTTTTIIRQKKETEEVVLYVSISDGKKIEEGMEVNIYPTTLDRSEYGHMVAVVKKVAQYVTTDQEIFNKIGDQTLASMFTQNGSVIEVDCELVKDESSVNGYAWSTDKGKQVSLKESTIVTAEIITDEQHPITILIPFLKDKLENLTSEEK